MSTEIKVVATDFMKKPSFKMTIEERLFFNDCCDSAVGIHDPNWAIEDRDICLGNITTKGLVKHWLKSRALMKNGFIADLDPDAMCFIEDYWQYKNARIAWKHLKSLENDA